MLPMLILTPKWLAAFLPNSVWKKIQVISMKAEKPATIQFCIMILRVNSAILPKKLRCSMVISKLNKA